MYLIQILLPLKTSQGEPVRRPKFLEVRDVLTEKFGGLTVYSRSPAEGLWQPDDRPVQFDDVVVYEVMAETIDRDWWSGYRRRLENQFEQESLVVRATPCECL